MKRSFVVRFVSYQKISPVKKKSVTKRRLKDGSYLTIVKKSGILIRSYVKYAPFGVTQNEFIKNENKVLRYVRKRFEKLGETKSASGSMQVFEGRLLNGYSGKIQGFVTESTRIYSVKKKEKEAEMTFGNRAVVALGELTKKKMKEYQSFKKISKKTKITFPKRLITYI